MAGGPGVYGKRSYDENPSGPQIPIVASGVRDFKEGLQPFRMCTYFSLGPGRCNKGEACTFAHNPAELKPGAEATVAKTPRLEQQWSQQQQQQSRPVQGQRKLSKMCEFFLHNGRCLKGNDCNFAHTGDALNGGLPGHEARFKMMQQQQGAAGIEAQPYGVANDAAMNYRRFAEGEVPTLFCKKWLYHPSFCMAADTCTFAHGLAEMLLSEEEVKCVEVLAADCKEGATVATLKILAPINAPKAQTTPTAAEGFHPDGIQAAPREALPVAFSGKGTVNQHQQEQQQQEWGGDSSPSEKTAAALERATQAGPAGKGGRETGKLNLVSRFGAKFMPTRLCGHWVETPTKCHKPEYCTFAHGVHELHPKSVAQGVAEGITRFHHTGFTPGRLCKYFQMDPDRCYSGMNCSFAHFEAELRAVAVQAKPH